MTRELQLREFGLTPQLVSLCTQRTEMDVFDFRCSDPIWYSNGATVVGDLAFMWSCCDSMVACRKIGHEADFIEFDIEEPDQIKIISMSEQGLLFNLFVYLIEDQDWDNEECVLKMLRKAASVVGFCHLEDALAFQEVNGNAINFHELLNVRTNQFSKQSGTWDGLTDAW